MPAARKALLVDTNLLILLVVGLADPQQSIGSTARARIHEQTSSSSRSS
jgi:hypothetical protein